MFLNSNLYVKSYVFLFCCFFGSQFFSFKLTGLYFYQVFFSLEPLAEISKSHFLSFSEEFLLLFGLLFLVIYSAFLRKSYSRVVVSTLVYIYTLSLLIVVLLLMLVKGSFEIGFLFNYMLMTSYYSTVIKIVLLFMTVLLLLTSEKFLLKKSKIDKVEYSLFIGFSLFFIFVLLSAFNTVTAYLALEGLGIVLYVLATFPFRQSSFEGSIKYFCLAAISSCVLLYGFSLLYGVTGTLQYGSTKFNLISFEENLSNEILRIIILCLFFGFLFKIAAFPCHMWAPDVYESTWLFSTAYFMTVVKTAIFFFFLRLLLNFFYFFINICQSILLISSVGSLVIGCFSSIYQTSIKRILAYSSINQVGFALMGACCMTISGISSAIMVFVIYVFTSLLLFITILNTESLIYGSSITYITDLNGLSRFGQEWASLKLTLILFSMAGIPPLAGFWGKYYVFLAAMKSSLYLLVVIAILISVINSYIYIKLVKNIWFDKPVYKQPMSYYDIFLFNKVNKSIITSIIHEIMSMGIVILPFLLPWIVYSCDTLACQLITNI